MHNGLATPSSVLLGDNRLLRLERLWIRHFSTFEHTRDETSRRQAQALLDEIERDIAMTPADSRRGLAVKIRCCLGREERELDRRPWIEMMQSLLSDLDG
ncbi:MAG: hypothetical protein QNJ30_07005 [Kiloniellales bacterium]|nr:hypothetical protein [Kiloniellales bacterium]